MSIRDALKDYAQEPEKFKVKRPAKILNGKPNPFYAIWDAFLTHIRAKEAKQELPEDIYNNFYKFAFVRNPWDWQVSMYYFILKETGHVKYELVKSMSGFAEYLEWVVETDNPYAKGATKFQKDTITDADGQIIVDYIGRYENLSQDFKRVCNVLNIESSLPMINNTVHRDYRSYYNPKTQKIVAEYFKEDIELFGYTFD